MHLPQSNDKLVIISITRPDSRPYVAPRGVKIKNVTESITYGRMVTESYKVTTSRPKKDGPEPVMVSYIHSPLYIIREPEICTAGQRVLLTNDHYLPRPIFFEYFI